jgi:multidrug resistance protein, MATE family
MDSPRAGSFTVELDRSALAWEGRPFRELLRLSGPMVISLLSVSAMTLVDTLFIGWLGSTELAAVGLGGMGVFTVVSFGTALFGAARVRVGEAVGQGNDAAVRSELGAFLRVSLVLGLISTAVALVLGFLLPRLTDDLGTALLARDYMMVRGLSCPLVLLTQALAQWRQARGDSAGPMRATLVANAVHAPLDAALIFGLELGVAGAAWASVASALVEAGLLVWLQRPEGFFVSRSTWPQALSTVRRGLPSGLERVLDMIAFTVVPLLLLEVGPVQVAAHQIVLQLSLVSFLPLIAISEAVCILVSQVVGAGRPALLVVLTRSGVALAGGYAALLCLLFLAAPSTLIRLFNGEGAVVLVGVATLRWAALLQLINAFYNLFKGILRGLSSIRLVAWVTVVCAWTFTPPLTFLWGVRGGYGAPGAWLALCVEVSVGTAILGARLLTHPLLRSGSAERTRSI